MSYCGKCKQMKPVDQFGNSTKRKNGLRHRCKKCEYNYMYQDNPERRKANIDRAAKWQKEHRSRPVVHRHCFPTIAPLSVELAYIAGFVDAEGSFTLTQLAPKITIYGNNTKPLEFIASKVGGAVKSTRRSYGVIESNLSIHNQPHIRKVCEALLPYLVIKKNRAQCLLDGMLIKRDKRPEIAKRLESLNGRLSDDIEVSEEFMPSMLGTASETDKAYCAGFLDGDGTIGIQNQDDRYFYPNIGFFNTKVDALTRIQAIIGGSISSRKRNDRYARAFTLRLQGEARVIETLKALQPYVIEKKEQLELAVSCSELDRQQRVEVYEKMKALNAKNSTADKRNRVVVYAMPLTDYGAGKDIKRDGQRFEINLPTEQVEVAGSETFSLQEMINRKLSIEDQREQNKYLFAVEGFGERETQERYLADLNEYERRYEKEYAAAG